jgi:hypothetical protein
MIESRVMRQSRYRYPHTDWIRPAWRVLIALSAVAIAAVAFAQHRHRAATAAFNAARPAALAKHLAARDRFRSDEKADPLLLMIPDPANRGILRPRTRGELEQSLFAGRAVPTTLPVPPNAMGWHDTERNLRLFFDFRADGTWSGYLLNPIPDPLPAKPRLLQFLLDIDSLRRVWVGSFTPFAIGPMLWFALLVASFVWKRVALPLAHADLAVAWLCFLGWLLNPAYTISWRGVFSNDMLFWGALMLAVSGGVMWAVARRPPDYDPTRCRACGYDLTGNVSGVCPECGSRLDDDQPSAAAGFTRSRRLRDDHVIATR